MESIINFFINYVVAPFLNGNSYEFVTFFLEILMWLVAGMIFSIMICYILTKEPWKKAYRMLQGSLYLSPILYTIIFFVFRIYLSIPFIIGLFFLFSYLEKRELIEIVKKFKITDKSKIKQNNKLIVLLLTLSMIGISLLVLHFNAILLY